MLAREARKRALQLETLEWRELLTYEVAFGGPAANFLVYGSEAQSEVALEVDAVPRFEAPREVTVDYAVVRAIPHPYEAFDKFLYNATQGSDYEFDDASGSLTFEPGQTTQYIRFHVNDDALLEPEEAIKIVLRSSNSDVFFPPTLQFAATYVIQDNDAKVSTPLADPDLRETYLTQTANFWLPTDGNMALDSGLVFTFTHQPTGQIAAGHSVYTGTLTPVQNGVKGQPTPFVWLAYDRPVVSGNEGGPGPTPVVGTLPAVAIGVGDNFMDYVSLTAQSNDSDALVSWYVIPTGDKAIVDTKAGAWYALNSKQVPADVRVQFPTDSVTNTDTTNPKDRSNPVVTLVDANLVKAKKGATQIVLNFNAPLPGGSNWPLGAFQLTTLPKGKKPHPKRIPLVRVAYDPAAHTITLTPRGKLNLKTPLKLTVSGLPGGTATLILSKRGASIVAMRGTEAA